MRRAACALCAQSRALYIWEALRSASAAAVSVGTNPIEKAGLPFKSRAQWEAEERSFVRKGLSPFKETDKSRVKPRVVPAHLSSIHLRDKLGSMVDKLQIIEAVAELRQAEPQALRPISFHIVINACMRTGKESMAFDVFLDMKRRELTPTPHTFSALIRGLLKTRNLNPRLLARVKSAHKEWIELYQSSAEAAQLAANKGNIPTNSFLQLLSRVDDLGLMFDVYYKMPKEGPLAPNLHTYTILLQALADHNSEQDVSSAISIWNSLCRDEAVPVIDAHAFSGLSEALLKASEQHKLAVLQIARESFGFLRPLEETAKQALADLGIDSAPAKKRSGVWQLHYKAISSIFNHLGQLGLSETAEAWLRQILTTPSMAAFLDGAHIEKLLWQLAASGKAEAAERVLTLLRTEGEDRHRPTRSAYAYALQACLPASDSKRAFTIFEMHESDIRLAQPKRPTADVKCLAILAALAHSTRKSEAIDTVIGIAERTKWLPWTAEAPDREPKSEDPDARSRSTALTLMTDAGRVDAARHAQVMAKRAEKQGDSEKAASLRERAELLAASDAGTRARYLDKYRAPDVATDPDFVARAESHEQALHRDEHRNRYWTPKLARALLRCLDAADKRSAPVPEKWTEYRSALTQYFAQGSRRGVSVTSMIPMPTAPTSDLSTTLGRGERQLAVPKEYTLTHRLADAAFRVIEPNSSVPNALATVSMLPSTSVLDPRTRSGKTTALATTSGAKQSKLPRKQPGRRELRVQRRVALQGQRTRSRPRTDMVEDRRVAKAATRKPLRLHDIRPPEGARGRRYV